MFNPKKNSNKKCMHLRLKLKCLYFSERTCDDSSVVYYDGGNPDILYQSINLSDKLNLYLSASGPQCGEDDLIFDQTISRFSLVQEFGFVCER